MLLSLEKQQQWSSKISIINKFGNSHSRLSLIFFHKNRSCRQVLPKANKLELILTVFKIIHNILPLCCVETVVSLQFPLDCITSWKGQKLGGKKPVTPVRKDKDKQMQSTQESRYVGRYSYNLNIRTCTWGLLRYFRKQPLNGVLKIKTCEIHFLRCFNSWIFICCNSNMFSKTRFY